MLLLLGGQKLKKEFSRMTKQVAECEKKNRTMPQNDFFFARAN